MIVKKRHITLIELMIAISLTLGILSTLSFFYDQVFRINRKMDAAQNNAFKLLYVENRLSTILTQIFPPKDPDVEFIFFTSPDSKGRQNLIFSFDNGVKLDKMMSYNVVGRLYLDDKGVFSLATFPGPNRWKEGEPVPMKKEILVEGIDSLSFLFFDPKANDWISDWPKENEKVLPPLIKVILTKDKEEIVYAYQIPNSDKTITYTR